MEPPPFAEAQRCDVCSCSFTAFKRRHHCRCCGRTLCADHSSNQMALPQFGLHSPVRVCADCFNDPSRRLKKGDGIVSNKGNTVNDVFLNLNINSSGETEAEPSGGQPSSEANVECKCGMPLCICEAPKEAISIMPVRNVSSTSVRSNSKPKKTETTLKSKASSSNIKNSTIFHSGQATDEILKTDYEVSGEGLREAIKNGDTVAAQKLLNQGVDANYRDKQGSSLLHLAAVFNQTDIAFGLMDHGASLDCKNSQGETPLDCAPAMLQYKMKKKLEENK